MFYFINFRLGKMDAWHGNLKVAQIDNDARNQAQASEQFLASIKLASNKAICLKTKKINKSNMYF
jgi:hypothetical protein